MRSKKRDDVDLVYKYAGQIFAEMLGQTCHEEFYTNDQMQYQEVRPPHPPLQPASSLLPHNSLPFHTLILQSCPLQLVPGPDL
jgi:hypothetical protein